jgi:hypothetical protein
MKMEVSYLSHFEDGACMENAEFGIRQKESNLQVDGVLS